MIKNYLGSNGRYDCFNSRGFINCFNSYVASTANSDLCVARRKFSDYCHCDRCIHLEVMDISVQFVPNKLKEINNCFSHGSHGPLVRRSLPLKIDPTLFIARFHYFCFHLQLQVRPFWQILWIKLLHGHCYFQLKGLTFMGKLWLFSNQWNHLLPSTLAWSSSICTPMFAQLSRLSGIPNLPKPCMKIYYFPEIWQSVPLNFRKTINWSEKLTNKNRNSYHLFRKNLSCIFHPFPIVFSLALWIPTCAHS